MSLLGKLLGLVALQRGFANTTLFQQFLVGAGRFILFLVVTAFMVGVLLVAILYAAHHGLITYGLTADAANIVVLGFALIITLALVIAVNWQLQKLQNTLHHLLRSHAPIPSKITDTAEAFFRGLNATWRPRANTRIYK